MKDLPDEFNLLEALDEVRSIKASQSSPKDEFPLKGMGMTQGRPRDDTILIQPLSDLV